MDHDPALDPAGLARARERLAALIPGYTGYSRHHAPEDEDRAVREALARELGVILGRCERALRRSGSLSTEETEDVQNALEALGRYRDRIHFAPAGGSSFFAEELDEFDRQTLLALDVGLWAAIGELGLLVGDWDQGSNGSESPWPGERFVDALFELDGALEERERFLRR